MDSTSAVKTGFRHPERWNSVPVPERVSERAITNVDKREDGCWISRYSVASHGYSQIGWQTKTSRHVVLGHRAAWVHVNGQVPLGMTLDHTCKERRCVNPEHLRALPNFENARRIDGMDWPMGTCANGHSSEHLMDVHSRLNKAGGRRVGKGCSVCYRLYGQRAMWSNKHAGEPMPDHLLLASERTS